MCIEASLNGLSYKGDSPFSFYPVTGVAFLSASNFGDFLKLK